MEAKLEDLERMVSRLQHIDSHSAFFLLKKWRRRGPRQCGDHCALYGGDSASAGGSGVTADGACDGLDAAGRAGDEPGDSGRDVADSGGTSVDGDVAKR